MTATSSVRNSRSTESRRALSESARSHATSAAPRIWIRNGWMKFMWPTWPIVGLSAASPVSTRLPPWRPATHVMPRRCWLSAKNFSTLTCRIMAPSALTYVLPLLRSRNLPAAEHVVDRLRVRRGGEALAERLLREHLREFGEELQMLLGGVLGDEQHEHLRDRLAVGRVEGDRCAQPRERALRLGEPLDAAVRNRDALAEPRRAELLARGETLDDQVAAQAEVALEQPADGG